MRSMIYLTASCAVCLAFSCLVTVDSAWAQGGNPPVNMAPAPQTPLGQPIYQTQQRVYPNTYGVFDLVRQATQYAETVRRDAISRQLQLKYGAATRSPIVASPYPRVGVYAPIGARATARAVNRAYRGGYPVLPLVSQYVFGGVLPDPSQPIGHTVTPTGPNGYVYDPLYSSDVAAARQPTLAPQPSLAIPRTETSGRTPQMVPVPTAPGNPAVESIPAPAAEPEAIPLPVPEGGPREF